MRKFTIEDVDREPIGLIYSKHNGWIPTHGNLLVSVAKAKEIIKDLQEYIKHDEEIEEHNKSVNEKILLAMSDDPTERRKQRSEERKSYRPVTLQGYVYIVQVNKYYKIGITKKPKDRLVEYTKMAEEPITITCRLVDNYTKIEKVLHEMFKTKRVRGEWFDLKENELQSAIDYINSIGITK